MNILFGFAGAQFSAVRILEKKKFNKTVYFEGWWKVHETSY